MGGGRDDVVLRGAGDVDLGIDGLSAPALIGQGGFGAVYRAQQEALGRTVAVKILSAPGLDDRTRDRFARECMAIGALSGHPHIVTVFDSGINGWGRPYIVMDYMARGSIADRIASGGALPWPEAADMGIKICGAVASAHAAGILHRDIKPQNVLISAYGEPKLGDFGISSIGGEQTSSGSITASLEHAAPELLDAAPATTGSDVYALASTIYTMVAGECPFPRGADEPIQSLIARIVAQPVPDLRPRGVPGALCDVLERGLAKSPEDRYASVTELADALRRVQDQHGLAPTAVMDVAPAGGFELLDRYAPRSTGTTAPTRARIRNEYVPPSPAPETETPLWKRPVFVGVAALVMIALVATAFALTAKDPVPQRTQQAAAISDDATPSDDTEAQERGAVKKARERKQRQKEKARKLARKRRVAAGGGGGIPAPLPPSSGSSDSGSTAGGGSAPATGGTSSATNDGKEKSSGGGGSSREEQPNHPPAPNVWLYHVWKGKTHYSTTSPNSYPSDFKRQAVGLVYNYEEEGTRPIETAQGAMFVFVERFGDTRPDVNRYPLYKMTKGTQYFYTTSVEARNNWHDNWGWSWSDDIGYAGK